MDDSTLFMLHANVVLYYIIQTLLEKRGVGQIQFAKNELVNRTVGSLAQLVRHLKIARGPCRHHTESTHCSECVSGGIYTINK